jgi:hypothetical protein
MKTSFRRQIHPGIPDLMLTYFISMLEVRLERAKRTNNDTTKCMNTSIVNEICTVLDELKKRSPAAASLEGDRDWIEAARLERLLVLIEPKDCLLDEVKSRLAEALDEKLSYTDRFKAALNEIEPEIKKENQLSAGHENLLRHLLLKILEEIHWTAERKYYSQFIRKSATRRIVTFGVIAFLAFIMPYIKIHIDILQDDANTFKKWSFLPLYTAVTAGWFGAMFSRLLYLHLKWDALSTSGLKTAQEYTSILLRGCVGMTGAVIVFFFLHSGIVSSTLLPKFGEISLQDMRYLLPNSDQRAQPNLPGADVSSQIHLIFPNINLALLVVWSFLAGFSERLVPSLLRDTERSLERRGSGLTAVQRDQPSA